MRLVVALAVMLLAVLPHATLAASASHGFPAAGWRVPATPHDGHGMHAAQAAVDCHGKADSAGETGPSMPSCCILGCGLLGAGPVLAGKFLTARWRTLPPLRILAEAEAEPEPAERPPRYRKPEDSIKA